MCNIQHNKSFVYLHSVSSLCFLAFFKRFFRRSSLDSFSTSSLGYSSSSLHVQLRFINFGKIKDATRVYHFIESGYKSIIWTWKAWKILKLLGTTVQCDYFYFILLKVANGRRLFYRNKLIIFVFVCMQAFWCGGCLLFLRGNNAAVRIWIYRNTDKA